MIFRVVKWPSIYNDFHINHFTVLKSHNCMHLNLRPFGVNIKVRDVRGQRPPFIMPRYDVVGLRRLRDFKQSNQVCLFKHINHRVNKPTNKLINYGRPKFCAEGYIISLVNP